MILLLEGFIIGAGIAFPCAFVLGVNQAKKVYKRVANQYQK
jgi:hypothetical protein